MSHEGKSKMNPTDGGVERLRRRFARLARRLGADAVIDYNTAGTGRVTAVWPFSCRSRMRRRVRPRASAGLAKPSSASSLSGAIG